MADRTPNPIWEQINPNNPNYKATLDVKRPVGPNPIHARNAEAIQKKWGEPSLLEHARIQDALDKNSTDPIDPVGIEQGLKEIESIKKAKAKEAEKVKVADTKKLKEEVKKAAKQPKKGEGLSQLDKWFGRKTHDPDLGKAIIRFGAQMMSDRTHNEGGSFLGDIGSATISSMDWYEKQKAADKASALAERKVAAQEMTAEAAKITAFGSKHGLKGGERLRAYLKVKELVDKERETNMTYQEILRDKAKAFGGPGTDEYKAWKQKHDIDAYDRFYTKSLITSQSSAPPNVISSSALKLKKKTP